MKIPTKILLITLVLIFLPVLILSIIWHMMVDVWKYGTEIKCAIADYGMS